MMITPLRVFLFLVLMLAPITHAQDTPLSPITAENAAQIEQLAVWEDMTYQARDITFNDDLTGFLTYSYDPTELSLWSIGADFSATLVHTTPVIRYAMKHQHVAYQISADDPILHLWDVTAGIELAPFENAAPSTPLAWNADATRLAYATDEDTIEVWDILTRERIYETHLDMSKAKALAFVPPSDDLLMQLQYNSGVTIHTRDFEGQGRGFFLQTPIQQFESILFSPDQSRIFITESFYRSGENGYISITDVWGEFSSYEGTFEGSSLGFLPNGLLYSGISVGGPSRETTLILRDPNTLDIRKTFVYGGAVATSARGWEFSPDGTRLVTVTWDYAQEGGRSSVIKQAYTFWDVESGEVIAAPEPIESAGIVVFSPDSTLLATDKNHHIALWDAQTGELLATLTGHTDAVTKLAFSSDGTRLISTSNDNTMRVWGIPAK